VYKVQLDFGILYYRKPIVEELQTPYGKGTVLSYTSNGMCVVQLEFGILYYQKPIVKKETRQERLAREKEEAEQRAREEQERLEAEKRVEKERIAREKREEKKRKARLKREEAERIAREKREEAERIAREKRERAERREKVLKRKLELIYSWDLDLEPLEDPSWEYYSDPIPTYTRRARAKQQTNVSTNITSGPSRTMLQQTKLKVGGKKRKREVSPSPSPRREKKARTWKSTKMSKRQQVASLNIGDQISMFWPPTGSWSKGEILQVYHGVDDQGPEDNDQMLFKIAFTDDDPAAGALIYNLEDYKFNVIKQTSDEEYAGKRVKTTKQRRSKRRHRRIKEIRGDSEEEEEEEEEEEAEEEESS